MTIAVSEKLTEEVVSTLLDKIEPAPKLFDPKKYFNRIALKEDPLKV